MQTVNLPSGARAEIRAVCDVTERQRRPIKRMRMELMKNQDFAAAMEKAQGNKKLTKSEQDAIAEGLGDATEILENLNDALVVALVAGYNGAPLSVDTVLDLPARDLDMLREVVSPYMSELLPDFSPQADRESPTGV